MQGSPHYQARDRKTERKSESTKARKADEHLNSRNSKGRERDRLAAQDEKKALCRMLSFSKRKGKKKTAQATSVISHTSAPAYCALSSYFFFTTAPNENNIRFWGVI